MKRKDSTDWSCVELYGNKSSDLHAATSELLYWIPCVTIIHQPHFAYYMRASVVRGYHMYMSYHVSARITLKNKHLLGQTKDPDDKYALPATVVWINNDGQSWSTIGVHWKTRKQMISKALSFYEKCCLQVWVFLSLHN